jgi:hypothetical protein
VEATDNDHARIAQLPHGVKGLDHDAAGALDRANQAKEAVAQLS